MPSSPVAAPLIWIHIFQLVCYTAALGCLYHGIRVGVLEYREATQLGHPRLARTFAGASQILFFAGFVGLLWAVESWAHFRTPFYVYDLGFGSDLIPRLSYATRLPANWVASLAPIDHPCSTIVQQLMKGDEHFQKIPLSVLLLEASLTYAAMWTALLVGAGFRFAPFLAALIMVNIDAILDPVVAASHPCDGMVGDARPRLGLWHWYMSGQPSDTMADWYGIPLFNYAAWWAAPVILISLVMGIQYLRGRLWPRLRSRMERNGAPKGPEGAIGLFGGILLAAVVAVLASPNFPLSRRDQWVLLAIMLLVPVAYLGIRIRKGTLTSRNGRPDPSLAGPLCVFILLGVAALLLEGVFLAIPGLIIVAAFCVLIGAMLTWSAYPQEIRAFLQRVLDVDRFLRIHYLGFAFLLVLLGSFSIALQNIAAVEPPIYKLLLGKGQIAALIGIAFFYHVWGFLLNDVIDLPIDRTQERRRDDPLVQGRIDRTHALAFAAVSVPAALALTFLLHPPREAYLYLVLGMLLMVAYNQWGKRFVFPPLTDLVQASAWACLAIFAATAVAPSDAEGHLVKSGHWLLVYAIAAYGGGFILLINGIHGGLRDLANDLQCGARTTAIYLGARVDPATGEAISNRTIVLFAFAVHLAMFVLPSRVLLSDLALGDTRREILMIVLYGFGACSLFVLWNVVKPHQPDRDRWIGRHLLVLLLPAVVAFIPYLDAAARCLLLVAFFAPLLLLQEVVVWVLERTHPAIAQDAIRPPPPRQAPGLMGAGR